MLIFFLDLMIEQDYVANPIYNKPILDYAIWSYYFMKSRSQKT